MSQRKATENAAEIAGLKPLRIINEPTAAAMACGFHKKEDETIILVFDLGGGTFDITIGIASEGNINVETTRGDSRLGGLDLDHVIMAMCMD